MTSTSAATVGAWVASLGAKQPTPGGGAAAALAASLGCAAGAMASIYTTRKKDVESGVAGEAEALAQSLNQAAQKCLEIADEDAAAYAALQQTWKKDSGLTDEQKQAIEAEALSVPVKLVRLCHKEAAGVQAFLPKCNPNIVSDAKVAIHLLAGGARAAFQTVMVNRPDNALTSELVVLLGELTAFEAALIPTLPAAASVDATAPSENGQVTLKAMKTQV